MPSSSSSPTLPFSLRGGSSSPRSLGDHLAFARSVLTNRRVGTLLAQLGAFLCFCWLVLGWAGGSEGSPDSALAFGDASASGLGSGSSSYRGTFAPVSCPADGCTYARFETAFDRILNGTAGPTQGAPIDQDRSRYEHQGIMFNPALLRMPPGARYELAVLTRGPSPVEISDQGYLQRRTVIAYFADLERGVDVVQKTDSWLFDLQTDPSPGCEFPWGATPGPEDPRAVWSPEGVPVMIIGMDTVRPEACRTMGVMDLRVLWPALRDELERIAWPSVEESGKSAKELDHGTEVWFDGQGQREKNWAAFFTPFHPTTFAGSLPLPAFHYDFDPQALLFPNPALPTPAGHAFLPYEAQVPAASAAAEPSVLKQCMERVQGNAQFQPVGFKVGDHHATPFHPVTLRARGQGKQRRTPDDTVLVGLAHAKFFDDQKESHFWYDRYVIVLNATAPYRPIAVSPYLNITSLSYDGFYFTQSITFLPTHASLPAAATTPNAHPAFPLNLFVPAPAPPPPCPAPPSLSDGFIDDDVLIGMGEADGLMGAVRMSVRHMLADLHGCGADVDVLRKLVHSHAG